jgi:formate hydrogenlyase subunit 3/multisubunit Na+/H+ antiporter MnhD subunit
MIDPSLTQNKIRTESLSKSKRKDLEGLLKLAEELQEKYEYASRRISWGRLGQVGSTVLVFFASTWFVYKSSLTQGSLNGNFLFIVSIIVFSIAIVGNILLYEFSIIQPAKRRIKRDVRALAEVVELLRETESVITKAEDWSALERAEFRIRLSRFGIGRKNWDT